MTLVRFPDLSPVAPVLVMINHLESHKSLAELLNQIWAKGHPQPQAESSSTPQVGPFQVISYKSVDQLPTYSGSGHDLQVLLSSASESKGSSAFGIITPSAITAMKSIPVGAIYLIKYPADDPAAVLHAYYSSIVVGIQALMNTMAPLGAVPLHIVLAPVVGSRPPVGSAIQTQPAIVVKDFLANLVSATRLPTSSFTNLATTQVDGQKLLLSILSMGRAFFIDLANQVHTLPDRFVQVHASASLKHRSRVCLMAIVRRAFLLSIASFCDQDAPTIQAASDICTHYKLTATHTAYLAAILNTDSAAAAEATLHTPAGLASTIVCCYEAAIIRLCHHYELIGPTVEVIMLLTAYLRLYGETKVLPLSQTLSKIVTAAKQGKDAPLFAEANQPSISQDFLYPNVELYSYNRQSIPHTPISVDAIEDVAAPLTTTPLLFNMYRLAFDSNVPTALILLATIHALLELLAMKYSEHQPFTFGSQLGLGSIMHQILVNVSQIGLVCEAIRLVSLALSDVDSITLPCNSVQTAEQNSSLHRELFKATSLLSVLGNIFPADLSEDDTALLGHALKATVSEASKLGYIFPQSGSSQSIVSQRLLTTFYWHRRSPEAFRCLGTYFSYVTPVAYTACFFPIYSDLLRSLDILGKRLRTLPHAQQPISAFIGFPAVAYSFEDQLVREPTKIYSALQGFFASKTTDGMVTDTLYGFFTVLIERIIRAVFDHASSKQGKLDASERLISYYASMSTSTKSSVASIKLLSYLIYAQLTTNVPRFLSVSSSSLLKKDVSVLLADTRKELINPATVYKTLNSCDMDLLRRQLTRRLGFLFGLNDTIPSELKLSGSEFLSLLLESFDSYSMALACLEGRAMKASYSPNFFIMKLLKHEEMQEAGVQLDSTDREILKKLLNGIITQAAALSTPIASNSFAYPIVISQLAWNQPSFSIGESATLAAELTLPGPILEISAQLDIQLHVLINGSLSDKLGQTFVVQTILKPKTLLLAQQRVSRIVLHKHVITQQYTDETLAIRTLKMSYIWQKANTEAVDFKSTSSQTIDYSDLITLQARESRFSSVKFYLRRYKENTAEAIHKNTYCLLKCSESLCAHIRDPLQMVESGYCLSSPDVYAGKPFILYLYLKAAVSVPPVSLIATYTCSNDTLPEPDVNPHYTRNAPITSSVYTYFDGRPSPLALGSSNTISIGGLASYSNNSDITFIPFIVCASDLCHLTFKFTLQLGSKKVSLSPHRGSTKDQVFETAPQESNNICTIVLHRPVEFVVKTDPLQTLSVFSNGSMLRPLVLSQWTKVELTNRTHNDIVTEGVSLTNMPTGEILSPSALQQVKIASGGKLSLVVKSNVNCYNPGSSITGLFNLKTRFIVREHGSSKLEDLPLCCIKYRSTAPYIPRKLQGTPFEAYVTSTETTGSLLCTGVVCHEIPVVDMHPTTNCPFLVIIDKTEAKCHVGTAFEYMCEISVRDSDSYTMTIRFAEPPPDRSLANVPPLEIVSDKTQLCRAYTLSPNAKINVSVTLKSKTDGLHMTPELLVTLNRTAQHDKKWEYVHHARKILSV
ncbi:Hypothetical protein DHA2_151811 [Giardia duodenalis]|uniref:Uncharacterized protein n=1 Tax=Giardia intestinalis TaxID=5741 RepID=V6TBW3_GIAIN|nr:Hypothetical protein DHA2_151811 [Giardia intestinalis]